MIEQRASRGGGSSGMRRGPIILGAAIVALGITSSLGVRHRRTTERGRLIAPTLTAMPRHDRLPEEARARLDESVRRARTGDVAALAEASRLFHANGFLTEATRCYTVLERLQPKEPRWVHRHATILAGYGSEERRVGNEGSADGGRRQR